MRPRDALKFSEVVCRLVTTDENRFCSAPSVARAVLAACNAESIVVIAVSAPATEEMSSAAKPVVVVGVVVAAVRPVVAVVADAPANATTMFGVAVTEPELVSTTCVGADERTVA